MKIETMSVIRDLMGSGKGWDLYDIVNALVIHEGMSNNRQTREEARRIEELVVRFNYTHHHAQFEQKQYWRWQRMNHLITTKVCNGLPVTQAEKVHCSNSLFLAELYTY
jgi:hypothetical protein